MQKALIVLALGLATAGSAFAEVDGKAAASGSVAAALKAGANPVDAPTVRAAIGAALEGGLTPDEKDLIEEIAAGAPVAATIDGRAVLLEPAGERAREIASLLLAAPNLHTLWHRGGPAAEQFVELARWSPATHQRIYTFIGNQLDDAWKKSTLMNAFVPYQEALTIQWKAFETLPADVETRTVAYDVLTTGIAYSLEKAKAENREPPKDFLYMWVTWPENKQKLIAGKPPPNPPTQQAN